MFIINIRNYIYNIIMTTLDYIYYLNNYFEALSITVKTKIYYIQSDSMKKNISKTFLFVFYFFK